MPTKFTTTPELTQSKRDNGNNSLAREKQSHTAAFHTVHFIFPPTTMSVCTEALTQEVQ